MLVVLLFPHWLDNVKRRNYKPEPYKTLVPIIYLAYNPNKSITSSTMPVWSTGYFDHYNSETTLIRAGGT